ncbi:MAG TPA: helix-turn-helix domain-containing protein [Polyangiaceae bacterium]|jgi:AraC-like DNA-binding protein
MDKTRTKNADRPRRDYYRLLPRFWITLPEPIVRGALEDPLLSSLFPSHVGYFPRAAEHHVLREQALKGSVFNYCVQGEGYCIIDRVRHEVRPGDLMVAPGGHPHAYGTKTQRPWTIHWFHAMGTQVPRLLEHLGVSAASPVVHLGRSAELEALFTEVREALENDYSEHQLLYSALALAHLMGFMIRLTQEQPRHEPTVSHRVRATLDYMQKHLAARHEVGTLAELAALSPSRYSELVHASTGYPPKEYLTRLRMHRATQLLDTTTLPIRAIAQEVGFADPLHFSRVFRRINERSPREYRGQRTLSTAKE